MAGDDARAGECGSARWESAANVIILDKMSPTRARAARVAKPSLAAPCRDARGAELKNNTNYTIYRARASRAL